MTVAENLQSTRFSLFLKRTDRVQEALRKDIEVWRENEFLETSVKWHVEEFFKFCIAILDLMGPGGELSGSEEDVVFKTLVIGHLTSQWRLLRQVAMQRLDHSPYLISAELVDISTLDLKAAAYYQAVRNSLPAETQKSIAENTPLIFLGSAAELTFFHAKNTEAPALISIPFDVRSDSPSLMAIAHEVGHAIFDRIPSFIEELSAQVEASLTDQPPWENEQEEALYKIVMKWTGEIVPDLVGVSMAGKDFVSSSRIAMAVPKKLIDVTDETHPLPLLRPYVSYFLLDYLKRTDANLVDTNELENLAMGIGNSSGPDLGGRVVPLPALTASTADDVRDVMLNVVEKILECRLAAFGNVDDDPNREYKRLVDILIDSKSNFEAAPVAEGLALREWGAADTELLFLDLSNFAAPEYAVPVAFPNILCDWLGRWINCT